MAFYRQAGGGVQTEGFWQGRGCNFCSRTGYQERVGVFELLPITSAIKKLLIEGVAIDTLRASAREQGMETLLSGGVRLVDEGVTTIAEIMSSVYVL
jgi:type IV pilus assembly protein PilB